MTFLTARQIDRITDPATVEVLRMLGRALQGVSDPLDTSAMAREAAFGTNGAVGSQSFPDVFFFENPGIGLYTIYTFPAPRTIKKLTTFAISGGSIASIGIFAQDPGAPWGGATTTFTPMPKERGTILYNAYYNTAGLALVVEPLAGFQVATGDKLYFWQMQAGARRFSITLE